MFHKFVEVETQSDSQSIFTFSNANTKYSLQPHPQQEKQQGPLSILHCAPVPGGSQHTITTTCLELEV